MRAAHTVVRLVLLGLLFACPRAASAQIVIPYPAFVAGTVINPDEVNANNTTLASNALNRTGGTATGPMIFSSTATFNGTTAFNAAATFTAALIAQSTLAVTGAATFGSTVGVTGATTLSSTLGVTGATTLGGTLGVTGATTLSNTLGVSGAATLSSTLAVTGTSTLTGAVGTGVAPVSGRQFTALTSGTTISSVRGNNAAGDAAVLELYDTSADSQYQIAFNDASLTGALRIGFGSLGSFGTEYWSLRNTGSGTVKMGVVGDNLGGNASIVEWSDGSAGHNFQWVMSDVSLDGGMLKLGRGTSGAFGTELWRFNSGGHLVPGANNTYDIGDASNRVREIFVDSGTAGAPAVRLGATTTGLYASGSTLNVANAGVLDASFFKGVVSSTESALAIQGGAFGTGNVSGALLQIGNNTSGNGAASLLQLNRRGGTFQFLWVDAAGDLRIAGTAPHEDNTPADNSGTVVGTQTSSRACKNVLGPFTDRQGALDTMLSTPLWRFTLKSGAYGGQEFVGITTEDSPVFGMDFGKAFNPVSSFGFTVAALQQFYAEFQALKARVDAALP